MPTTKFGFTLYTLAEFETWIASVSVARTVRVIQEHHTWSPRYAQFNGSNHFDLQRGMKNHHVNNNGWADIGQNFTTFPDGTIMTGRPLNNSPACIFGNNANSICIENLGDFDSGKDAMTNDHAKTIVGATAALLKRFSLGMPNTNNIVYHHWFDLNTGARTNGTGTTKSCPGTAFFGGNTVAAAQANFLPKVAAAIGAGPAGPAAVAVNRWVCVNVDSLNIRTGPDSSNPLAPGTTPAKLGSILRVYAQQNNWLKISNSKDHWVSGTRTYNVTPATVNTDDSKCRTGPGTSFPIINSFNSGFQLFVHATSGGWSRVAIDEQWVSSSLLT
ncbi:N-acetylmuramoyl-L-alanine amidase [Rhizobium sp.]